MRIAIVTGMSGAGKTSALRMLEDVGYYCVDNMPISLIINFAHTYESGNDAISKVAFGIDIRSGKAHS